MTAREGDGIEAVITDFERIAGRIEAPNGTIVGYSVSADEWRRLRAALRASAPDDGLRAAVEALADEWDRLGDEDPYDAGNPGGCAADLRALLADQPPTQPEGDDHA